MNGENELNIVHEVIEKLKCCLIRNSSIIGFIRNNPVSLILYEGESILVKGKSDREWIYISSKNKNEFNILLQSLKPEDIYFASLEDWMIAELTRDRKIDWQLATSRYFLPEKVKLPENKIKLSRLNRGDALYVIENSNYKQFITKEYLNDRIESSFSACIRTKGKLVAWALTHDDGAIGALHVLDEFRKMGYAKEIICNLSHQIRKTGNIPITQIEEKNTPAVKLVEKLGFQKDRNTSWLKII